MTLELIQGSQEWLSARAGSVGASQIADVMARTKTGPSASRENLMARMIAERLTGQPQESFTNSAMDWGRDNEAAARECYEFVKGCKVVEVGLFKHPTLSGAHASPDGLVADDGLVEIKAPNTATHIATLLGAPIADKYVKQMQFQMACCGRRWCDFASYDPRLGVEMQLHVRRVERDDALITEIEEAVAAFLAELDDKVARLTTEYRKAA